MRKHNLHISTVFFLMILLTFFCVNANAFMIPDEDDLTKTVDYVRYYMYESEGEKLATVYDFVDYDDLTELNILSEIDGYKVIEIEAISEPGDFPNLEEITIGENVEKISLRAFYGLSHLKKVNLPSSLTYIGVSSFSNCTNLESVNLEKVQHIGREAFFGCINLKNVNLSETLDIIEPYSFSQSGLETITIPSKAALTSKDAEWSGHQFSNCLNLKTVIFEDRADKSENFWIDSAAFMGCENLEEVHLPETDSEITIYGAAFRGCKKLKTFDFSNVSIICDGAFANCVKLTEIIFSEKLKALGCHTFENTGLKNITIPSLCSSSFSSSAECFFFSKR